jgi:hypothetical protein
MMFHVNEVEAAAIRAAFDLKNPKVRGEGYGGQEASPARVHGGMQGADGEAAAGRWSGAV